MGKEHNLKVANSPKTLPVPKPLLWLFIPFMAIVLYANTLTHDYTQDDAIVIYDNMYTTDGVSGIPGLLRHDTFRGFFKTEGKSKLVSGGRYRPFTPIMFAVEYELVGRNPMVGHLVNMLLYAFLGIVLFFMLLQLLSPYFESSLATWIALGTCLLYISHPIHTEAVANIKGRDEIMAMLCSVSSIWLGLRYLASSKIKFIVLCCVVFFIGLMSKENTITFLAIWPLSIFLFKGDQIMMALRPWLAMLLATIVFLVIRTSVLGFDLGGTPMELMNNPYLKLVDGRYVPFDTGEKFATIIFTLGKYLQLLVFPHPLTHDYYPKHIDMKSFSDLSVVVTIVIYFLLAAISYLTFRKRPTITFGILFFIATLSIVSNLIFPIGTNMSERFLFMPSFGYSLLLATILLNWTAKKVSPTASLVLLGLICIGYSAKTISRNTVWKSDFTLFTTDVKTSINSAKVLNAAGGALTTEAYSETNQVKRENMLREAIGYLNRSLGIHPGYKNAALIMGNAHYYLLEYDNAIKAYERALSIAPGYKEAERNLAITLRDAGQYAGEKEKNIDKSLRYLRQSYSLNSEDVETVRLLGIASGILGNHADAIKYFKTVVELNPSRTAYQNLGLAYGNSGQLELSDQMFAKAESLKK